MDYSKMKLKAGLEVHQQLDTGKLFSRTPSLLRNDKPDYEVMRRLHAVAGETGDVDVAVMYESALGKEFVYQGYDDTISLVELDEEPPQSIDEDALNEAIKIALLFNCELYPVSQVMRKTVIDGSNTSGFQRTVLIGHSGYVETSFGKVGIESVALEEDAARIIERGKERVIFRLDRLGIPLVEVTTGAELDDAEKIKECALKIGENLRACKVKRGIGTIRQDLNISTKRHDRVEIKGFQDPKMMVKTVELEVERQQSEIKNGKKKGEVRNAIDSGDTKYLRPLPGKARMYPETDLPLLRISKERIDMIKKKLPKLREEIRDELKRSGLSGELINLVLKENKVDEFETLMRIYDKDSDLIGKMVTLWRSEFAKKYKKKLSEVEKVLSERVYEKVLEAVRNEELEKGHVREVLIRIIETRDVESALQVEKASNDEIEEEIRRIIKEKPGLSAKAYMGLIMAKMKGRVDARNAMEIIQNITDER